MKFGLGQWLGQRQFRGLRLPCPKACYLVARLRNTIATPPDKDACHSATIPFSRPLLESAGAIPPQLPREMSEAWCAGRLPCPCDPQAQTGSSHPIAMGFRWHPGWSWLPPFLSTPSLPPAPPSCPPPSPPLALLPP